jgi:hypothetical protein
MWILSQPWKPCSLPQASGIGARSFEGIDIHPNSWALVYVAHSMGSNVRNRSNVAGTGGMLTLVA